MDLPEGPREIVSNRKPDIVVPQEAAERGQLIRGELRSDLAAFPEMLAQFSKIYPKSRKGTIYLYPSLDQARGLFALPSPFSFEGSLVAREGVEERWKATGIWLKSGSQITHKEALYWTFCSGRIERLDVTATSQNSDAQNTRPFAWFTMNRCFVLQLLANQEEDELVRAKQHGFPERSFSIVLSDGATAEIRRYMKFHKPGVSKETKKTGYSLCVRDFKDADRVKKDAEAVLILASFASRERTMFSQWSTELTPGDLHRHWMFNIPRFPKRPDRTEPLLPRDHGQCGKFLGDAFQCYRNAKHTQLLDAAVYALLDRDLTLETQIVRLFSGIQSALVFALQEPKALKRPQIRTLYEKFMKKFAPDFSDLWPLLSKSSGPSLSDIRNAAVHGEVFTESDWQALSYAGQNLQWLLERIILISLGWDFHTSAVSPQGLRNFYAHRWQPEQSKLKV